MIASAKWSIVTTTRTSGAMDHVHNFPAISGKILHVLSKTWCRARRTYDTEGEEVVRLPRVIKKREGAEDTVCSIVHNIVSRDVTLKIHTHKSQTSSCDSWWQRSSIRRGRRMDNVRSVTSRERGTFPRWQTATTRTECWRAQ